ncbi:hypothetical protein ACEPAF_8708 [Sanghuangporus sanghuang]
MTSRTKYLFEEMYLNMSAEHLGYTVHGSGEGDDLSYEATNSRAFPDNNLVVQDYLHHSAKSAFLSNYEINILGFGLPQTGIHYYHSPLRLSYGGSSSSASASVGPSSPANANSSIAPPALSLQDYQNNPATFFHMQRGSSFREHHSSSDSSAVQISRSFDGLFTSVSPTGSKKETLLEILHGLGYLSLLSQGTAREGTSNTFSSDPSTWMDTEVSIGDFDSNKFNVDKFLASVPPVWLPLNTNKLNMSLDSCSGSQNNVNRNTTKDLFELATISDGGVVPDGSVTRVSLSDEMIPLLGKVTANIACALARCLSGHTSHGAQEDNFLLFQSNKVNKPSEARRPCNMKQALRQ